MSTFIDKLNKIAKGETASIGFRKSESGAEKKQIQLIAIRPQSDPGDITGADAVLLTIEGAIDTEALKTMAPDIPWGAWLKSGGQKEVKALEGAGCDFIVFSPDNPLNLIEGEDTGKVLEIDTSLSDALLRTIFGLPADAILVSVPENAKTLTWKDLMDIQRFGSISYKPLFVRVTAKVTASDLEALWNAGVNAIVIDGDITKVRKELDKADFTKKPKNDKGSPLIGRTGTIGSDPED